LNKYEFAYVSSAEEFVAARTLAKSAGAEYPFLGVGDPQLQSPVLNGKSGGELLASRGAPTANGTLTALPNLPETGTELRKISSEMPGSVLLLANEATKAKVLREPLGHFNTIEFATHGLITGDLKGIMLHWKEMLVRR
jgi:CHAT domain-containing protein